MIAALHSTTETSEDAHKSQDRRFHLHGNYYRSRFSEYLFNALAKKNGLYLRRTRRWTVFG